MGGVKPLSLPPRGQTPEQPNVPAGVTFSDTVSATEPCKPCTQCVGLQSMSAPCVESDDALCRCAYGYFQDEASGSCRECRVCEAGFGLMFPCKDSQDTVCEECPEGTFSSEANFVDPCLPCTTCEENEVLVRECTALEDAECRGKSWALGVTARCHLAVTPVLVMASGNSWGRCPSVGLGRGAGFWKRWAKKKPKKSDQRPKNTAREKGKSDK